MKVKLITQQHDINKQELIHLFKVYGSTLNTELCLSKMREHSTILETYEFDATKEQLENDYLLVQLERQALNNDYKMYVNNIDVCEIYNEKYKESL